VVIGSARHLALAVTAFFESDVFATVLIYSRCEKAPVRDLV
jgi:hypothetical protein